MSILDIKAKSQLTGHWFNVEMPISEDYHFDKRAIYYWAKLVTEQLSEGMMFKELKKLFALISWTLFLFPRRLSLIIATNRIINTSTDKDNKLHDIFELHYVELRKFTKSYQQITTALDRWAAFLTC